MGWDLEAPFFVSFTLIILLLLLIVGVVVAVTRRNLADSALLSPRRLVEGYIFTVVLVSMLLVSSGLGDLLKWAIARRAGIESTYRPQPVDDKDRKQTEEPRYEYNSKAPRRDLLSGVAQLGVGAVMGLLHLLGLRRLGRTEPLAVSPIYRVFLIAGLVIYTSAVLIYAVESVKDLLVFRYVGPPVAREWYDRPLPGAQIAGLIGYLPLWGVLVALLFRYARPRNVAI
jgi:ABC-type Fe3+-siderophore transport system permease subunit